MAKKNEYTYALYSAGDCISEHETFEDAENAFVKEVTEIPDPEKFYQDYLVFKETENNKRRSQPVTITVGTWEDLQQQIRKLESRIGELEWDIRKNYSRIHNSLED